MRRRIAGIAAVVAVLVSAAAALAQEKLSSVFGLSKFVKFRMAGPKGAISRADAGDFVEAWTAPLR